MLSTSTPPSVGKLLRSWRQRRRLSQLELASHTDISTRHLSFVETGRSQPSRVLILRLASKLGVPLREQNQLLLAAGYAPKFTEKPLGDPALRVARDAIERILQGHEPYPALAVDRAWNLIAMNRAVLPLLDGVAPQLLDPPINVLRLSLHPQGLAPRILNLAVWRRHLLERLRQQVEQTADGILADLLDELHSYPAPSHRNHSDSHSDHDVSAIAVPLLLETPQGILSLISTTTVFGTPTDVTLSELALETFFPADETTAVQLQSVVLRQLETVDP